MYKIIYCAGLWINPDKFFLQNQKLLKKCQIAKIKKKRKKFDVIITFVKTQQNF